MKRKNQLAPLIGYKTRARIGERPKEPYYAFIYDNILLPIEIFRQYYDTDGEIDRVALGDNRARWN